MYKADTPKPKETNVQWDEIVIPEQKVMKCDHYFEFVNGECRCTKCPMGLLGVVELKNGRPV